MTLGGVSNACGAIVRLCEDGMLGNCEYGSGEAGSVDTGDGVVSRDGVAVVEEEEEVVVVVVVVVAVVRSSFGYLSPAR